MRWPPGSPRWPAAAALAVTLAGVIAASLSNVRRGPAPAEVWFAPNLGSEDLVELFRRPEQWPEARANVDVLQLYVQHLVSTSEDCPDCGGNLRQAFVEADAFVRLRTWGIGLALETSAVKDWGCVAGEHVEQARDAIATVERQRGRVDYLVLDEPRLGAEACGFRRDEAAAQVADLATDLRRSFPHLQIGLVEPWPRFDVAELAAWVDAIERRGGRIAFLHVDVDRRAAEQDDLSLRRGLRELEHVARSRGLAFGVILWSEAGTEPAYAADLRRWTRTVVGAVGWPEHAVFQSFTVSASGRRDVPANLPEDEPHRHTALLRELVQLR